MQKLLATIKDDEELKAKMIDVLYHRGEEYVITYFRDGKQVSSNIILPAMMDDFKQQDVLIKLYGGHILGRVKLDCLPEEQRKRFRAAKVRCGKHNDLWSPTATLV